MPALPGIEGALRKSDGPPELPPRFPVAVADRVAAIKAALVNLPDFTEPEGDTFVVTAGPVDIVKDGEVIGYEVWMKYFDADGYEIDIDPHRQFLYPPDGSYLDDKGIRQHELTPAAAVRDMIAHTVRATPGRVS